MKTYKIALTSASLLATVTAALAVPIHVDLGTAAPPATLGGYTMEAFPDDTSPIGSPVLNLTPPAGAPVSGDLSFNLELSHFEIGSGWATWSHGYSGDVYSFDEVLSGSTLTMLLPTDTMAFQFYVEPSFFALQNFAITVETTGGSSSGLIPAMIGGQSGAVGFGFYSDDPADSLKSIVVEGLDTYPDGFAVGEFAINSTAPGVPDGGCTVLLLGAALSGLGLARRYGLKAA